ncbi:hypothetical protein SAMN04488544_2136 [Microlunatus sagamiharensis]|uniref:Lipoprotein n=1 Tax=Microlunatus sagamiharensis TaxID=546874 RepID=A0A1H2MIU5_9ACTN|nr:hypothetical protein [Microlunatus sagamiharensis]SDU92994.1 hypothetical protein SAMN04488544_2136 [Microlunatus sagamiharensis]
MNPALRRLLAALLLPALAALAACGGSDEPAADAAPSSAAAPSETAPPTPSPSPTVDVRSIEIEAQGIGIDVGAWSVKHDFRFPADEKEFAKVPRRNPLPEGMEAGYERTSAKKFQVCVTQRVDGQPVGWAVYDSVGGTGKGAAGAPTQDFCP